MPTIPTQKEPLITDSQAPLTEKTTEQAAAPTVENPPKNPWYKNPILQTIVGIGGMVCVLGMAITSLVLATKFPAAAGLASTGITLGVIQQANSIATNGILNLPKAIQKPSIHKVLTLVAAGISLGLGIGSFIFPPLAIADAIVGLIFSAGGLALTVANTIKTANANKNVTSENKANAEQLESPTVSVMDTLRNGLSKTLDFITSPKGIKIIATVAAIVLGACAIAFPPVAVFLGAAAAFVGIGGAILGIVSGIFRQRAANAAAESSKENNETKLDSASEITAGKEIKNDMVESNQKKLDAAPETTVNMEIKSDPVVKEATSSVSKIFNALEVTPESRALAKTAEALEKAASAATKAAEAAQKAALAAETAAKAITDMDHDSGKKHESASIFQVQSRSMRH